MVRFGARKYAHHLWTCMINLIIMVQQLYRDFKYALTSFHTTIQEPEELFETISQALLSSVDRDCLSGWGGHVYVV